MNEVLFITQIIEKNGRSYVFMSPYASPFDDIYSVLQEFEKDNREKQRVGKEMEEKQKLESEMKNAAAEAAL